MKGMKKLQAAQEKEFEYAFASSDMYQFLSLFFQLPTDEITAGLLDGSIAEDICAIMNELDLPPEQIDSINDSLACLKGNPRNKVKLLSEMRKEYTRLFSHPENPVIDIYETLFLADIKPENEEKPALFISPAALDAERCYKKAGLILSKEVREPADHMATEMEFMAYLHMQKAKALHENNTEKRSEIEGVIEEFTDIHLKKWALAFFEKCITSSHHPAYKIFGEIGKVFMEKVLPANNI